MLGVSLARRVLFRAATSERWEGSVPAAPFGERWAWCAARRYVAGTTPGHHRGRIGPLARGTWSKPADAAKVVAWLVSDEADWVTGQTIASDGGWSFQ
jgi:NAD(P)-dependent dehydrogenase (short-subunit alcohol dehydrogenase family)